MESSKYGGREHYTNSRNKRRDIRNKKRSIKEPNGHVPIKIGRKKKIASTIGWIKYSINRKSIELLTMVTK